MPLSVACTLLGGDGYSACIIVQSVRWCLLLSDHSALTLVDDLPWIPHCYPESGASQKYYDPASYLDGHSILLPCYQRTSLISALPETVHFLSVTTQLWWQLLSGPGKSGCH